ncbi:cyclin-T-like [Pollicipes pollicipes]|uniref:cyclin-T-like n=1 Tax=Pollicipes pollicipes TaxID=41117 RepID=UPI0018852D41|nr:cyclin-T-like [Pollicipes pollicipes]
MATQERWFFPKEKLANTPSKKDGIDIRKELFYRQQAATLIQDMGQKLMVSQLCINSAIVYMHRFYMFHSFSKFHRNLMAPCCLFLACKVEEQPRKLEHLLKVGWSCMNKEAPQMDVKSERFKQLYDELVRNENILLATLGFDCSIDHPHTHVVKCCQLIKASRDLAQTSYFMATNSLHLTMMCLEYRSTLVACVCIYLVYKWSGHEIPKSSKGKDWFWYVDRDVTLEQLERVSEEFLLIFNQCPSKLKKKIMNSSRAISDQEAEQRKRQRTEAPPPPPPAAPPPAPTPAPAASGSGCPPAAGPPAPGASSSAALSRSAPPSDHGGGGRTSHPPHQSSTSQRQELHKIGLRAYKEKKEREHFKAEKKTHGERDRRPSRPQPPSKPESVRPGAAGDAPKPRPDALHKPSSVTDVRNLLKEVDSRHSLLHSVEHPAHRGAEPARPLQRSPERRQQQ